MAPVSLPPRLTRHGLPSFEFGEEVRLGFERESTVVLPLDEQEGPE